jgi:CubicO group peptidase (beta-lactamase class C family)
MAAPVERFGQGVELRGKPVFASNRERTRVDTPPGSVAGGHDGGSHDANGNRRAAVHGVVAPGFEPVRDVFARNFAEHGEVDAARCVHVDGEIVVDLHGGLADGSTGRPSTEDTLQLVSSATKGG